MEGEAEPTEASEEEHPKGTLVLLVGFILLIVVLWLWTYATLLVRA